jgi:hypothetical protein
MINLISGLVEPVDPSKVKGVEKVVNDISRRSIGGQTLLP